MHVDIMLNLFDYHPPGNKPEPHHRRLWEAIPLLDQDTSPRQTLDSAYQACLWADSLRAAGHISSYTYEMVLIEEEEEEQPCQ